MFSKNCVTLTNKISRNIFSIKIEPTNTSIVKRFLSTYQIDTTNDQLRFNRFQFLLQFLLFIPVGKYEIFDYNIILLAFMDTFGSEKWSWGPIRKQTIKMTYCALVNSFSLFCNSLSTLFFSSSARFFWSNNALRSESICSLIFLTASGDKQRAATTEKRSKNQKSFPGNERNF